MRTSFWATIVTTALIAALWVLSSGGSSSVKQKRFIFHRTPRPTSPDGIESAKHRTDRHARGNVQSKEVGTMMMRAFAHISFVALLSVAVFGQSTPTKPAFQIADVHVS